MKQREDRYWLIGHLVDGNCDFSHFCKVIFESHFLCVLRQCVFSFISSFMSCLSCEVEWVLFSK
jgi:hypothetical protein